MLSMSNHQNGGDNSVRLLKLSKTQIKDLELDTHIKTLNDYKTPPELAEGKKQLGDAKTQIDDLMTKFPPNAPNNLIKAAEDLQLSMNTLNSGVDDLIIEVSSIVVLSIGFTGIL